MVRAIWVGVAFVCGVVLGVFGTRMLGGAPAATNLSTRAPAGPAAPAAPAASAVVSATTPAELPAARSGSALPVTRAAPAEPPAVPTAVAAAQTPAPVAEGAAIRKIDVGDAFHQQIDRPSVPGFPNEFGDAHRALEQETRDDSWAYQMEAEMQNSLTAFVSTGELQVRYLECRTTICELRLYASNAHRNAMNTWQDVMQSQPWMRRVRLEGMGLSAVEGGGDEGLWIFRKPPQP
jgi:hypothetical protein